MTFGKLGVPEHIINKPGKLHSRRVREDESSSTGGCGILDRVAFPYPVGSIDRRFDHESSGMDSDIRPPCRRGNSASERGF